MNRRTLLVVAAVAFAAAIALTELSRRRPRGPSAPLMPIASSPPSGQCLPLVAEAGPAPCPFEPREGIDWGSPFERGRECVSAGALRVHAQLTAVDPFVGLDQPPFATRFPAGTPSVWLSRGCDGNAFALVAYGERPARWELARDWDGGSSYFVDTGTGCFADARTARLIRQREDAVRDRAAEVATREASPASDRWREVYDREAGRVVDLLAHAYDGGLLARPWVNLCVDPDAGENLVAFTSGAGDGTYLSYVGFDARDEPVALLTDFRIAALDGGCEL